MSGGMEIQEGVLLRCTLRETEAAVPGGVHTIGPSAFKGCVSLERVHLPDTLREIGASAFKGCRRLRTVTIPAGLERLGEYAFYRCHALREIILPAGVQKLGDCTFLYCDSLENAAIPGVVQLGRQVFLNGLSLRTLTISPELPADQVCDVFTGCGQLSRFQFPDGSLYELDSPIQALLPGFQGPDLVRVIARDVYRSMELRDGVMLQFRTNLPQADIPEGITEIGKSCFYDKRGIVSVKLPKSLRAIRSRAFRNCISLERLELGSLNIGIDPDAFQNCSALRHIVLPDGRTCELRGLTPLGADTPPLVREIHTQLLSDFVLSGTTLLQYLGREARPVVPEGVRVIGRRAFAENDAIDRVILPDTVEEIQKEAFADCPALQAVLLPKGLRRLGEGAFAGCRKLIRCVLPEGITVVPASAFRRCDTLREVQLAGPVKEIGALAFDGCSRLPEIVLPSGLVKLGDMAFYQCSALRRIDIPASILEIGNNAFAKSGLTAVQLERSPEKWGKNCFAWCEKLKTMTFGEGVRTIGPWMTYQCPNLKSVNWPEATEKAGADETVCRRQEGPLVLLGDTVIDGQNCAGIVTLPEGVRRIGEYAFCGNRNLTGIVFPDSVETIEKCAFQRCTGLEFAELSHTAVIGANAFALCGQLRQCSAPMVQRIERETFLNCGRLECFPAPQVRQIGERAFSRCLSLQELVLPDGVCLETLALEDCARLEYLELAGSLDMECDSFWGCTALHTVRTAREEWRLSGWNAFFDETLPEQVRAIWISVQQCFSFRFSTRTVTAYHGSCPIVRIPDGVQEIGPEVFRDHLLLEELDIPDSVTVIGERAFHGTPWLERLKAAETLPRIHGILPEAAPCQGVVTIPADVQRVSGWAFANQYALEGLVLESRNTICEDFAFRNCINLHSITLPDGTTYHLDRLEDRDAPDLPPLVQRIFQDCMNCFQVDRRGVLIECTGNIPRLTIPKGIQAIGPATFANSNLLEEIILTPEVREIDAEAFSQCRWLEQVRGGSGVERIGDRAFFSCTSLLRVELGPALRELGWRAFENCVALEEILLPEGVTHIPDRAFFRCHALRRVVLPANLSVEENSFTGCPPREEPV